MSELDRLDTKRSGRHKQPVSEEKEADVRRWRWVIVSLGLLFAVLGSAQSQQPERYPIMHPDQATWDRWMEDYRRAPLTHIEPALSAEVAAAGSLSLLDHVQYTPAERNQGACGNCWVWAGTGVLEVALDVQRNVKERLSEQFLNSCASYCACGGGNLTQFADFYDPPYGKGFAIPWSNSGASWRDGGGWCGSQTCGGIATVPNYPISAVNATTIPTYGVGKAAAITNIKNVLSQNRAIFFGFYLPNQADWNSFFDFWGAQPESAVWGYDPCGDSYDFGEGAHAVVCVGYDDTNPANPYWIMLNSWGTTVGRPHGLFRVSMNIDYDCVSSGNQAFQFQTLDVTFGGSSATCVPARTIGPGESHTWNNGGAGSTDNIDRYACQSWNESGPEYAYTFRPSASGRVTATLSGMSADLDLFVLDGAGDSCSSGGCLTYGDSRASFMARGWHTYRLVVDGYYGVVSNYTLHVDFAATSYNRRAYFPMILKQHAQ